MNNSHQFTSIHMFFWKWAIGGARVFFSQHCYTSVFGTTVWQSAKRLRISDEFFEIWWDLKYLEIRFWKKSRKREIKRVLSRTQHRWTVEEMPRRMRIVRAQAAAAPRRAHVPASKLDRRPSAPPMLHLSAEASKLLRRHFECPESFFSSRFEWDSTFRV